MENKKKANNNSSSIISNDNNNFKPNDVILDQYVVEKIIGRGGMHSVIYLVNDKSVEGDSYFDHKLKQKAIKVIKKTPEISEQEWKKFGDEFITMWRIKKLDAIENIGEIYDYSTEEDTIYIIMEYVRGNSLSSIIKKNSFLTLTETLYILEKVLKVLDSLHNFKIIGQKEEKGKQNSIIHRDLKPDNIMVSLDKTEIKLIDFGISTSILFTKEKSESLLETSETDIYGTYAYLNPQVLEMKGKSQKEKENLFLKIGVQFDIYAVGVIFYEMLTGKKPFIEDNYDDIKTIFDAKNYDIPFISRYNEEIYPFIENMIIKMLNTSKRESKYNEYEYFGDKLPIYLNVSEILKDIRKVNELIKKNPKSPELYPPLLKPEFEDRNLLIRNLEIFNLKNVKFKWFEKTLWFVLSSLIAVLLLSIAFYFFIKKI